MNSVKYIGLDVHQATISVAVLDATGKLMYNHRACQFQKPIGVVAAKERCNC